MNLSYARHCAVVISPMAIALLAGCRGGGHSHTAHWSYTGETGPAHWGSLSPDYALCDTGRRQSPIDISEANGSDLPDIEFHYDSTPVEIVNNGHTIQVNYASGSWILVGGRRYDLAQFHFHAPSEHTVDGMHARAEMHLVHKAEDGALAVVGVMLMEGDDNPGFKPVFTRLPEQPGEPRRYSETVDASELLPADRRTWRYSGSLTTPPCSEEVRWFVMTEPVMLSRDQLAAFTGIYNGNNRPTQPLNGRTIQRDTTR